jgi:light-regulated signal transduction histidine kinase (bacteriophytochrome)
MATLIDDLLAFARVARSDLTSAPIDMQALVTRVVHDTTAGLAVPPRVTIGGLPPARGDAALLRQVIANLVGNAVKFSARTAAPAIAIDGARQGAMIEYSVRDNGVGFDPQYAHKLFGVFQRLHDRSFEGTGVGLAIVERIVMRHGGRVSATGAPGQGATFRFTLPAAQEGP